MAPPPDAALLAEDAATNVDPLADPDVITLAGDWHGDADFARRVIKRAPSGGNGNRLLVQLGDFGVWPGPAGTRFLDEVAATLRQMDAVLLFVDGNHEDHPQLLGYPLRPDGLRVVRPRLYHLPRGFRWQWHGQRWMALGGAHSIDRPKRTEGVDWWPEEVLTAEQAAAAKAGGPVDYLVTHDCPAGISMPGIRDPEPGQPKELYDELVIEARYRAQLRDVVVAVQPRRLFHGHYHVRHDARLPLGNGRWCEVTGLAKTAAVETNAVVFDLKTDQVVPLP